ncbi:factor 3 subunit K [Seminavis robusta]|uniref:Factor 3 subunit K n=1 Tax=Seminavis robusta TaxID=568900 RepID=A0A9N8HB68_9STRA|nr:factor 3 subunit K [Seminavis robusta]|eukprot:Sro250_g098970.1 factor 3 subunit K (235) ;mRNA; f:26187-26891
MAATPTEDEIKALVASASPYSPSNKVKLEAYLRAQATGNAAYSFEANRILMKLYQFFPTTATVDDKEKERTNSSLSLVLALLQYPNTTDLLALSCLIPERLKAQEPCASILQCAEYLDACQFTEFWNVWKSLETNTHAAIAAVPLTKHHAVLQAGICSVLALTYRTAPLKTVLAALDIASGAELTSRQDLVGIDKADASNVYFGATADNTKRNRVFQDVDFTSISNLMAKISKE